MKKRVRQALILEIIKHNRIASQEALRERLQEQGLRVLTARAMPPNDGAISLGQAWVARQCH